MSNNPTLEKNQAKIASPIIAEYTFKCSGAGVKSNVSPSKYAYTSGIRLHFMRYGLFLDEGEAAADNEEVGRVGYADADMKRRAVMIDEMKALMLDEFCETETDSDAEFDAARHFYLDEVEVLTLKGLPDLKKFRPARTGLRPGYIYIMVDDGGSVDKDMYFELQVDEVGSLRNIEWGFNVDAEGKYLDVRHASPTVLEFWEVDQELVKGRKLWLAYSEVQWSREYHEMLLDEKEKREARMVQLDPKGFVKGEDSTEEPARAFNMVQAVFRDDDPAAGKLRDTLHSCLADELSQDEEGENKLLEDMFVTLHDPMGCVRDVNEVVSKEVLSHKALVEAIYSGESHREAFQRLSLGEFNSKTPTKSYQDMLSLALTTYHYVYNTNESIQQYDGGEEGVQWRAMHPEDTSMVTRRLSSYGPGGHYSYGANTTWEEPDVQWRIGHGVSHDKLIGILGKAHRERSRAAALAYRDDLGKLMQSDYMRTHAALDDYLGNTDDRLLQGRGDCLGLLDNLFVNPIIYERSLILSRHHEKDDDKWTKWVYDIIDGDRSEEHKGCSNSSTVPGFEGFDPLYALLTVGINVGEVKDKSLQTGYKMARVYKSLLKYLATQTVTSSEIRSKLVSVELKQRFIITRMNKNVTYKGQKFFDLRSGDIVLIADDLVQAELDINQEIHFAKWNKQHPDHPAHSELSHKERVTRILRDEVEIIDSKHGRHEVEIGVKGQKSVDEIIQVENPKHGRIQKVVSGRSFTGFFALLELINFSYAITKAMEDDAKFKDDMNVVGSTVKLAEATMLYRQAVLRSISKDVSKQGAIITKVTGAAGAVFTSAMCFWDATEAFDKRDTDSAWALIGAGLAFGVSAGVSITTAAASASGIVAASIAKAGMMFYLFGPVGWVAALVGVGFLIWSQYLKDSALQTYFKHFLLSDHKVDDYLIGSSESPMAYNRRIYLKRRKQVDMDDDLARYYMEPSTAQSLFLDLVVCTLMDLTIDHQPSKLISRNRKSGIDTYRYWVGNMTATMTYYKFFNKVDQVDYALYFMPNGAGRSAEKLDLDWNVSQVKDEHDQDAVAISFSLEKKYRNRSGRKSKLLFVTRLRIDEQHANYFPQSLNKGEERWSGALITIQKEGYRHQDRIISFKIGTLSELKGKDIW